jgi:hypothetical protein
MARKVGHVLHDMLEAIERVEQITLDKTFADFEKSWEMHGLYSGLSRSSRKQAAQSRMK